MAKEKKDEKAEKSKKKVKARKKGKSKKKKKGASKLPVIGKIFLLLVFLAGQAYLAYYIVDRYYPDIYASMHAKSAEDFGMFQFDELVVNPASTNGKRYLLVEISLQLDDKEHISLVEQNTMELKQEMIETLSTRTVRELTDVQGRERLRRELSGIINSAIGIRSVRNLYFTKYLMQ